MQCSDMELSRKCLIRRGNGVNSKILIRTNSLARNQVDTESSKFLFRSLVSDSEMREINLRSVAREKDVEQNIKQNNGNRDIDTVFQHRLQVL